MNVCAALRRDIRFRTRAQSADDEADADLAESLQHLTLSEFLKEYVGGSDPDPPASFQTD